MNRFGLVKLKLFLDSIRSEQNVYSSIRSFGQSRVFYIWMQRADELGLVYKPRRGVFHLVNDWDKKLDGLIRVAK